MSKKRIGVFVMSYGTPENMEQVEAYYTHIRRGNPPTPEQLQDLMDRYEAIGGLFPLRQNTNKQVQALEDALNQTDSAYEFVCYQGLKHAHPLIEDGVTQMAQDGIKEAVGVVLAPHYSLMSIGSYIKRAKEVSEEQGIKINCVRSYHLHPSLIDALSTRIEETISRFKQVEREQIRVIFTAHSLPEKILELKDPYVDQLLETSKAIASKTGLTNWQFGWQSAGQTATPWLGPDILDILRTIKEEENVQHTIVCPIGFVSDHLEILYDLDIEAQEVAKELGMHVERTPSLNTDQKYIATLADVVLKELESK